MYEKLIKRLREESEYADLVAYMHGIRPISSEDDAEKIAGSWKELFEKAADAIEELSKQRDIALARLCDWCGVCSKEHRDAWGCDDIAQLQEWSLPRWIPMAEQMPKGGNDDGELCENVNLLLDDGFVTCGWVNGVTKKVYYLNARDDYIVEAHISRVTHWMPLPKPYEEAKSDG